MKQAFVESRFAYERASEQACNELLAVLSVFLKSCAVGRIDDRDDEMDV